jgi:hypothetical protein
MDESRGARRPSRSCCNRFGLDAHLSGFGTGHHVGIYLVLVLPRISQHVVGDAPPEKIYLADGGYQLMNDLVVADRLRQLRFLGLVQASRLSSSDLSRLNAVANYRRRRRRNGSGVSNRKYNPVATAERVEAALVEALELGSIGSREVHHPPDPFGVDRMENRAVLHKRGY